MKVSKVIPGMAAVFIFMVAGCAGAVNPDKVPASVGPYSQVATAGGLIFTSGQLPINPATGVMPSGIDAQTRQALENIKNVLEAAGSSMENVVKVTIFLSDLKDFDAVNDIYASYFKDGKLPARSCVQAGGILRGALLEVEAVAAE